jgi:hypothetical protein
LSLIDCSPVTTLRAPAASAFVITCIVHYGSNAHYPFAVPVTPARGIVGGSIFTAAGIRGRALGRAWRGRRPYAGFLFLSAAQAYEGVHMPALSEGNGLPIMTTCRDSTE